MAAIEMRAADSPAQNVNQSVHIINYVTQSLCIVFMSVFFFLRVYARLKVLNGFAIEDWFCLGAYILGVCYSIIALIMGYFGGGLHLKDVPAEHVTPFNKTVYVTMVMYGPTAFLTKISILWIMTRVFAPYKKAIYFIYVLLGLMLAYYIPAIIIKIRICWPISRFWLGASVPGTCLNEGAIILADAVISVISDLTILLLPLPLTLSLQMRAKKKMRVIAILGAGGLAVASSIIRLAFIVQFGNSPDATYAFMRINMFGNAEVSIGVICACLPALSALVKSYVREYTSNKATSSSQQHEMSNLSRRSQNRTEVTVVSKGSRHRLSITEGGSDKDILISHAQSEPHIETSIHSDPDQRSERRRRGSVVDGMGIMKTVDVSTTYVQM